MIYHEQVRRTKYKSIKPVPGLRSHTSAWLLLAVITCVGTSQVASAQTAQAGNPPPSAQQPGPIVPQGWTVSLGLGALVGTPWQGSRDTALAIVPDIRVNYKDSVFFSVPDGLGWNAINSDGWRAGPVIKPRFGRNEDNGGSPFLVAGGSSALRGMGDIGIAGEAGGFLEKRLGRKQQWRARLELRQGFGAHEGLVGDVSINYAGRAGRTLYSIGPRATYASRDFMQTYFGVDAAQSARTGLAVSRPGSGLVSFGLGSSIIRPLDRRRTLLVFGGVDRLANTAADTSLIRVRGQRTSFNVGVAYSFRFSL